MISISCSTKILIIHENIDMDINNVKDIDNAIKDNIENINIDKRILQDINKILYR